MINKELVKKRFGKSFKSYDDNAYVQKTMADFLCKTLIALSSNKFDKVLEIGSGTGLLTQNTAKFIQFQEFYANDIAKESEPYIKNILHNISFIGEDAETADFPDNIDLIISNAAFQWIENLPEFLKKLHSLL